VHRLDEGEEEMSTRVKLITALIVVVGILGVLIQTAVSKASTYYVTVNEILAEGHNAVGQSSTVSGSIVGSSVNWDPTQTLLQFSVVNETSAGGKSLTVVYRGAKPDDFTNNWPVIVSGKMGKDGVFHATNLLIKCPSKYKAQQPTYASKQQKI